MDTREFAKEIHDRTVAMDKMLQAANLLREIYGSSLYEAEVLFMPRGDEEFSSLFTMQQRLMRGVNDIWKAMNEIVTKQAGVPGPPVG